MTQKRILITSALPYINGVKHLGNLVGLDAAGRCLRALSAGARGHDTLFICATDEHGTPAELAALEEGLPVAEYCREMARRSRRSSASASACPGTISAARPAPQNHELTQHFARALWKNGYLEVRTTKQVYSQRRRALPARPLCHRHLSALRL